jgi:hypothetical protein
VCRAWRPARRCRVLRLTTQRRWRAASSPAASSPASGPRCRDTRGLWVADRQEGGRIPDSCVRGWFCVCHHAGVRRGAGVLLSLHGGSRGPGRHGREDVPLRLPPALLDQGAQRPDVCVVHVGDYGGFVGVGCWQHLEGLRVQYDHTVRDADGSVVQVRQALAAPGACTHAPLAHPEGPSFCMARTAWM